MHLLSAIFAGAPGAHLIWVSSCEVYGAPSQLPTTEASPRAPANPYAVSNAAGEMLAAVYASAHGLRITCARPYSHAGPPSSLSSCCRTWPARQPRCAGTVGPSCSS